MVITGNNRNSASPWPNPLLSLSLSRSLARSLFSSPSSFSILHPILPLSSSLLLFFLSLLFFLFLFLSFTHSSLSIRGIYHCPVRLIVLPRSWSVPGRKRLDRLFFFFPSFSFPISSSLPPSLSSTNQVKFSSNLASSLSPSPSSLLAHGLAIPSVFRRPVNLFRPSFRSALAPSPFPHFAGLIHSGFLSCMSG